VLTADMVVGGIHFFHEDAADMVAKKALRVNISDLAAKGAKPVGFLLSLALPKSVNEDWLDLFARGLGSDAEAYGCPLLGGDTTRTNGPVAISITALGTVPKDSMVRRSGARAGDLVLVTGTIGDAALGLQLRDVVTAARHWKLDHHHQYHLIRRYLLPQPRHALAETLRLHASAAMDVSDGLAGDLGKLCATSAVTAEIEIARVALSPAAQAVVAFDAAMLETVLTGGDDYEIVCTVAPDKLEGFLAGASAAKVPVVEIGRVTAGGSPPKFLDRDRKPMLFKKLSFSHF
jgi:thiamine-monophosphate kinase